MKLRTALIAAVGMMFGICASGAASERPDFPAGSPPDPLTGFIQSVDLSTIVAELLGVEEDDGPGGRYPRPSFGGLGADGMGIWSYNYRFNLDLPLEKRRQFQSDLDKQLPERLLDLGAGETVGGGGSGGSDFGGSQSFHYYLKGEKGEDDLVGNIHVNYISLSEQRVSIIISIHEFRTDVAERARKAIEQGRDVDRLTEALASWEQQPTAIELRAQRKREE